MPNQKIGANDGPVEQAQVSDQKFISDERRVQINLQLARR
jgi:hypothetical protein